MSDLSAKDALERIRALEEQVNPDTADEYDEFTLGDGPNTTLKSSGKQQFVDPDAGRDEIQAAIDALPAEGGTVTLRAGIGTIEGQINLDKPVVFEGAGQNGTALGTYDGDLLNVTSPEVVVRDLSLYGRYRDPIHGAIRIGAPRTTVTDVRIEDFASAIRVDSGYFHFVDGLRARNVKDRVFVADGGNDLFLNQTTYDTDVGMEAPNGQVYSQPRYGLDIVTMDAVITNDVDLIHAGTPLHINSQDDTVAGDSKWHIFNGGFLGDTAGSDAVHIEGVAGSQTRGIMFNNTWMATTNRGVLVDGDGVIDSLIFNSVYCHNHENEGMRFTASGLDRVFVRNSIVAGNNTSGNGANGITVNFPGHFDVDGSMFGSLFGWNTLYGSQQHRDHIFVSADHQSARVGAGNFFDQTYSNFAVEDPGGVTAVNPNAAGIGANVRIRAAEPDPTLGGVYIDDGTNRGDGNVGFRVYDGNAWVDI